MAQVKGFCSSLCSSAPVSMETESDLHLSLRPASLMAVGRRRGEENATCVAKANNNSADNNSLFVISKPQHSGNKSVYVFVSVNRALWVTEADCERAMLTLASQCLLSDPWDLFRTGLLKRTHHCF